MHSSLSQSWQNLRRRLAWSMTCPLKIRAIRVRAVKVPLDPPHKTASGSIAESPLVLTDVLTEEGVEGHSYVFCYMATALQPVALLVKALEPLLVGRDVS